MGAIQQKKKKQVEIVNERGFPESITVNCFLCKEIFLIRYNPGIGMPSQKNYWLYWVDENWDYKKMRKKSEEERGDKLCDECLKNFYLSRKKEFLNQVRDKSKRQTLRSYIYHKVI